MKMLHPDISNDLLKITDDNVLRFSEDKIVDVNIDSVNISDRRLKGTSIEGSLLHKIDFSRTVIEKFDTKDCVLKDCNLTASSMADSSWHAVEIIGARCSGLQLQNSVFRNVVFKSCKLELVNFRFSKLENVIFEDCLIDDIDFYNATLKNVNFVSSDIENIAFSGAKLKSVDLTESRIISVKGVNSLKGATINYEQLIILAPYFAQAIGIIVKD